MQQPHLSSVPPLRTHARATLAALAVLAACGTAQAAAPVNLALTGTASQSSTYPAGEASKAIDGNTDGQWWNGSVAHTSDQTNPWWQVRLAEDARIDSVVLWNRTDCCAERLSDVWLTLWLNGQQVASQWIATAPAPTDSFQFGSVLADTVRLERTVAHGYLQAAEVQVFGQVSVVPEPHAGALMLAGLLSGLGWAGRARRRAG